MRRETKFWAGSFLFFLLFVFLVFHLQLNLNEYLERSIIVAIIILMTRIHYSLGLLGVFLFLSLYVIQMENRFLIQENFCTGLSCSGSIGQNTPTLTGVQRIFYTGPLSGGIHKSGITSSLSSGLQSGNIKTVGFENMDIVSVEDNIKKGKNAKTIPLLKE